MTTVAAVGIQTEVADALEAMGFEILVATRKADALIIAGSLRHLASRCEALAEELPEQSL